MSLCPENMYKLNPPAANPTKEYLEEEFNDDHNATAELNNVIKTNQARKSTDPKVKQEEKQRQEGRWRDIQAGSPLLKKAPTRASRPRGSGFGGVGGLPLLPSACNDGCDLESCGSSVRPSRAPVLWLFNRFCRKVAHSEKRSIERPE